MVGVWTGYDDNKKTTSSDGLINKNVWADIVENYLKDNGTSDDMIQKIVERFTELNKTISNNQYAKKKSFNEKI